MLKKTSLFALALAVYTTGILAADPNAVTIGNNGAYLVFRGQTYLPTIPAAQDPHTLNIHNDAYLVQGSAPKRFMAGCTMGPGAAALLSGSAYAAQALASIALNNNCKDGLIPHTIKTVFAATTAGGAAAAFVNFCQWMRGKKDSNTAMWLGWAMTTGLLTSGMFILSPSLNKKLYL